MIKTFSLRRSVHAIEGYRWNGMHTDVTKVIRQTHNARLIKLNLWSTWPNMYTNIWQLHLHAHKITEFILQRIGVC